MSDKNGTRSGEENNPAPRSRRRWVKGLLIVSLALNLAVAGALGARLIYGPHIRHFSPSFGWSEGRSFYKKLPRARQRAVMQQIRQYRGEFAAMREAIRKARAQAAARLSDAKSSDAEIAQALGALGEQEAGAVQRVREIMGDISITLTAPERQALAQQILRRQHQHFGPPEGK